MSLSKSYRCKEPNPHAYKDDVLRFNLVSGRYHSTMSPGESWDPSLMLDAGSFVPMRQPKFGDPCQARGFTGFVLSHDPRGQVHPAMTTVALEDPTASEGYRTLRVFAHQVTYVDRDIDPIA